MFSSQESIGSAAGSHVLRSAQPLRGRREAVWRWGSSALAVPANIPAVLFGGSCVSLQSRLNPLFLGCLGELLADRCWCYESMTEGISLHKNQGK